MEVCADFPLGCKTQYRKYCSDNYIELILSPDDASLSRRDSNPFADIGVEPRKILSVWQPEEGKSSIIIYYTILAYTI